MAKAVGVITLFPECLDAVLSVGILRKAINAEQLVVNTYNPRDYADDIHRTVDDRPFGGGPGMVMKVAPLRAALEQARAQHPKALVVYLSPQGEQFTQNRAQELANDTRDLILIAGRYEGIDERLVESDIDSELSIGDFVLSGGEIAALAIIDAMVRLLPGVLGHNESAKQDSFTCDGLLDCPHYTRPQELDGVPVPEVLLSGDHARIAQWRREQALYRTWSRRPDLLINAQLTAQDRAVLARFDADKGHRDKTI